MDRLQAMRVCCRVAELGSFTRAAADLGLSRAAVSESVAALERHLGVTLLVRTTRRVMASADGLAYLARCRRILDEVEVAEGAVRGQRDRPTGLLRVDVPSAFGRYLLVPALPEFLARYPDLELDLRLNDRVVDLVAERVDVALRVGPVRPASHAARRIATTRRVICAAPGYLDVAGRPATPEDLAGHRLLALVNGATGRRVDWTFRGRPAPRLRYAATFNLAEAHLAAALAGAGLVQTLDILAGEHLARGRLEAVLEAYAADGPPISIVYPAGGRHALKVRVFAEFATALLDRWRATLGAPVA